MYFQELLVGDDEVFVCGWTMSGWQYKEKDEHSDSIAHKRQLAYFAVYFHCVLGKITVPWILQIPTFCHKLYASVMAGMRAKIIHSYDPDREVSEFKNKQENPDPFGVIYLLAILIP